MTLFPDFTTHPAYLRGQTQAWCRQLAAMTGKYEFPWNVHYEGPPAEETLSSKLAEVLHGRVLDVGCGHGAYTNRWAGYADEVIGYDMTEGFIATANRDHHKPNVRYVVGRTHDGLPFPGDYFDAAFTKKGPTSWFAEGNRIVKPGGPLVLFHPGDGEGEGGELGLAFPGLFAPPSPGTPILDKIQERLGQSGVTAVQITRLQETVWLPSPEDVLEMFVFGQNESYKQHVREACMDGIASQFEKHAGSKGLRTTGFYYLLTARAAETHGV
ncbi:class I SAM-dependent methyltransferase [Paenibacillus sp. R14(2021)]|uniref:class I SAM-dependent methyltransferase n=1 Tax=Paenibacillus sp. R14(2021) TaxID=2859228 RepID=UPI001C613C2B|nr:class I SAM-dependent methyltransferase [Paenibacillus sp. R14(2021)]